MSDRVLGYPSLTRVPVLHKRVSAARPEAEGSRIPLYQTSGHRLDRRGASSNLRVSCGSH
jgi:hypothetical protein